MIDDVWIWHLNKTYPNLWFDRQKVYAEPEKILNSKSGGISLIKNVPDWCIMPTNMTRTENRTTARVILISVW